MNFLSIVIPVYKVEDYIRQCLDSIFQQNLEDVEIILVDDGSPDSCPAICDAYAEQYNHIKVIHKKNGGSSSARNMGIEAAQGQYLMFLDSDDWWNPQVNVKKIFAEVRVKPDVEMFLLTSLDYIEGQGLYKRKEHEFLNQIKTDSVEAYYQSLLNNGNLEVHAATKIFKTEFIKQNNLYFPLGIKGEDNEWMIRVLRALNKVDVINQPLYIYRAGRMGSVSNSIKKDNILDLLGIVSNSLNFYKETTDYATIKDKELCFCAYLWFTALGLTYNLSKKEKKEVSLLFKQTKEICEYSNSRKTLLCMRIYNFLGFKITAWILGTYIKTKNKKLKNKVKVSD